LSCFAICFSAKSKSKTCSVAQWGQGCRFESRLRRTILNSFAHSLQLIVSSIGKFHFIQWYLEHCSGPAGHYAEYPRFSGNGYQEGTGPNKKSRSIVSGKGGLTEDGRSTIDCAELQLAASIWQESHRPPHHYFRRKRPSRRPVTPPPASRRIQGHLVVSPKSRSLSGRLPCIPKFSPCQVNRLRNIQAANGKVILAMAIRASISGASWTRPVPSRPTARNQMRPIKIRMSKMTSINPRPPLG
jgi:hypothetical protein